MKTTRIISLFAATLSLILAASVSAAPASKRIGSGKSALANRTATSSHVEHTAMNHVGPRGKGYACSR